MELEISGTRPSKEVQLFFFVCLFFSLLIYGCVGSSFLCEGFLQLRQAGATLHRGARASHHRGLSCCGAQAPDAQAQQLWLTGLVAPRHVGSSQTRARTRVPCIGRQIFNHCATREAPVQLFSHKPREPTSFWTAPWEDSSTVLVQCVLSMSPLLPPSPPQSPPVSPPIWSILEGSATVHPGFPARNLGVLF